ncbi:MAG TPA: protein kinase, partial [Planctomycetia bacterium]|nr:protein kinase [Planctomycetia bacterium]
MSAATDEAVVEALVEEYLDRRRAGEPVAVDEFLARRPDLADLIRTTFSTIDLLHAAAPEVPSRKPAQERFGEFRLVRELARGGMGVVYEAIQEPLGRRVALKTLVESGRADPAQVERFEREARTAAQLHHTNIVPIYSCGRVDGAPYFAMQFVEGCSAADWIRDWNGVAPAPSRRTLRGSTQVERSSGDTAPIAAVAPTVPLRDRFRTAALWAEQTAAALEFAHRQGVLHRDVKPANILVDHRQGALLADFGLAKAEGGAGMTQAGVILGTPRYIAPERFRGEEAAAGDVYALGATLYELLALRPAFDEERRDALLAQIERAEPPRLRELEPQLPLDLETIVQTAMAKEPRRRYASSGAMAEDLRRYRLGLPILARRLGPLGRVARWAQRHPALAGTSTALVVSLIAGLAFSTAFWRRSEGLRETADAKRKEAEIDRGIARQRLGEMTSLVEAFEDRLVGDPRFAGPGWEDVRKSLLETTVAHYRRIVEAGEGDERFAARLAGVHADLGQACALLGKSAEAKRHLDLAAKMLETLPAGTPALERDLTAARVAFQRGRSFGVAADPASVAALDRAETLYADLARRFPADPTLAMRLGAVWTEQARRAVHEDRAADGAALATKAVAALESALAKAPRDPFAVTESARAQLALADCFSWTGDRAGARRAAEQARAIVQRAREVLPAAPFLDFLLADALRQLAEQAIVENRIADAAAAIDEAKPLLAAVIRLNPASTFALARSSRILELEGLLLRRKGRSGEARSSFEGAARQAARAVELRADGFDGWLALANAEYQSAAGHPDAEERIRRNRRAIAAYEKYLEYSPRSRSVALRLGGSLNNLGMALVESGRPAEGEPNFRRAMKIQEDLLAAPNPPVEAASFLANHHYGLARVCRELGRVDEAVNELGEFVERRREFPAALLSAATELVRCDGAGTSSPETESKRLALLRECLRRAADADLMHDRHFAPGGAFATLASDPAFATLVARASKKPAPARRAFTCRRKRAGRTFLRRPWRVRRTPRSRERNRAKRGATKDRRPPERDEFMIGAKWAAVAALSLSSAGAAQQPAATAPEGPRKFKIAVPDETLADLKKRLDLV